MGYPCNYKSCTHCQNEHPDPNTCDGAEKCTADHCECEKFTPDYDRGNICPD